MTDPTTPGATPDASNTPNASTEPEAQLASTMGHTPSASAGAASGSASSFSAGTSGFGDGSYRSADALVPSRSDYEMPDDYADEDWLARTRAWIEANPGLAVLAAVGIGLVAGRLAVGLGSEPEPPTLSRRVERRAEELRKEAKRAGKTGRGYARRAQHVAEDAGESAQEQLARAADALRDAAGALANRAESGFERSKDLADVIADAAKDAFANVASKRGWMDKLRD